MTCAQTLQYVTRYLFTTHRRRGAEHYHRTPLLELWNLIPSHPRTSITLTMILTAIIVHNVHILAFLLTSTGFSF